MVCQSIRGVDVESQIDEIDDFLFGMYEPVIFHGRDGAEVGEIKGFEKMCNIIAQHIPRNPKKMTVLEFYQSLADIKEQSKPNQSRK